SLTLMVAVCGLTNANTRAARQDLPGGEGVEFVRDRCVNCHEADLIVSQRLSRQSWTREVEKMIRWGAVASDSEKEILIDYFAAHFQPRSAGSQSAAGDERGKQICEEKCLLCHEADLTEQQRLPREGWTRDIAKTAR